jgi:RND family efflux transporter MFP subunit
MSGMSMKKALQAGLVVFTLLATVGPALAQKYECLVEPYLDVELSSEASGILGEVHVDRGDTVKRDQALARLMSGPQEAHVELLKARAEFSARRAVRNEELYLRQMISPHEKDELETDAQLLKYELREAEEQLAMRTIRSPLDGVVVERLSSVGEYVGELPFLRLAQIDPLRIEAAVPAGLFGRIKTGMTGRVQWGMAGIGTRNAKVTVVDPVIDAASGTLGVRLEVANPDHRLPAGTQCLVSFPDLR